MPSFFCTPPYSEICPFLHTTKEFSPLVVTFFCPEIFLRCVFSASHLQENVFPLTTYLGEGGKKPHEATHLLYERTFEKFEKNAA